MFPEFTQGTFLWNWFNSYAGVHAMAISLIVAILAVGMTKWSPYRGFVKIAIMAGALATIPLGLDKMGFNLVTTLDIPMGNDQVATYLSFFGSVLAVSVVGARLRQAGWPGSANCRETRRPLSLVRASPVSFG